MRAPARVIVLTAALAFAPVLTGCGEPPNKEMNQAQGAIDAARAAGAERYAADEYNAAVSALQRSHDAADQRDFRLALNYALDSRERAQNAAREAATQRAQARSQAERLLAQVTAAAAAANERLEGARAAKVPAKALAGPEQRIAGIQHSLQEAGAALGREDYLAAQKVLTGRVEEATAAMREINAAQESIPQRPTRRGR